jgi:hypothetical protein
MSELNNQIENLLQQLRERKAPKEEPKEYSSYDHLKQLIEEAGFDVSRDKRAAVLLQDYHRYNTAEETTQGFLNTVVRWASIPSPSDAERPSRESVPDKRLPRQEALMRDYQREAKSLRGVALINLKMQYRKKGLDIS